MEEDKPTYEICDREGETVMVTQVTTYFGGSINRQVGTFPSRQAAGDWIADPVRTRTFERDQATYQHSHAELGKACKAEGIRVPRTRAERINALNSLPLQA